MATPSKKPWTGFGSRDPKKTAADPVPAEKPPSFSPTLGPYHPGDPIPSADATELNTDTTWALWADLAASENRGFADTVPPTTTMRYSADERGYAKTEPAPLQPRPAAAPMRGRRELTVDEVMVEARKNNRVCPQPARWVELYEMLPDKTRSQPSPPLVDAAWKATPSIPKRMCLREHVEWAAEHACLDKVFAFMKSLPEDEWHHMGE
jgi:hypothetical protein